MNGGCGVRQGRCVPCHALGIKFVESRREFFSQAARVAEDDRRALVQDPVEDAGFDMGPDRTGARVAFSVIMLAVGPQVAHVRDRGTTIFRSSRRLEGGWTIVTAVPPP